MAENINEIEFFQVAVNSDSYLAPEHLRENFRTALFHKLV